MIGSSTSETKQTQVELMLAGAKAEDSKQPLVKIPKEVVIDKKRTVNLDTGKKRQYYYVFSAGKILMSTPSIMGAILCADENMGVVIGPQQKYIWCRGRKTSQPMIGSGLIDTDGISDNSVARCLTYLLKTEEVSIDVEALLVRGETPRQILQEALENRQVIDLSGCSVSQVLYYVNLGTPVFAMVGDQAVLIIGYDEHNTILYQPMENSARKMGLQDSEAFFAGAGNVFLGYLE